MSNPLYDMPDKLRRSTSPVSAFFLVTSRESVDLMVQRLRVLYNFGVTAEQIDAIAETVTEALERYTPDDYFYRRCKLRFRVNGEHREGEFCYITNIPGKGFE